MSEKTEPTRREKINAAHAENLARLAPVQAARAAAQKIVPETPRDRLGNPVDAHRANTVHKPPSAIVTVTTKDGIEYHDSATPLGAKALAAQNKNRRAMITGRVAEAKKVSA